MDYALIIIVAFGVAALTFFSGFGLGSLLMPFFAVFFDVRLAIAATAVVHLFNNIVKSGLMFRHADFKVFVRFALPAAVTAFVGAGLLSYIPEDEYLLAYELMGRECRLTPVGLVIAVLIAAFAVVEIHPRFEKLSFPSRYIPLGGSVSGFLGGLSGHQGALRSAFLIRTGLQKEAFIGTAALSAAIVDVSRLLVYGTTFFGKHFRTIGTGSEAGLIIAGCLAAFTGTLIGRRLLDKVTMKSVQWIVGVLLFLLAAAIGAGVV
ncbi:MAG: sulfite exporter TauE/SafE family protein [bacterium]